MHQGFGWFDYNVLQVTESINFSNIICTTKIIDAVMGLKMVIILAEARFTYFTILIIKIPNLLAIEPHFIPFFILTYFQILIDINYRWLLFMCRKSRNDDFLFVPAHQ